MTLPENLVFYNKKVHHLLWLIVLLEIGVAVEYQYYLIGIIILSWAQGMHVWYLSQCCSVVKASHYNAVYMPDCEAKSSHLV